MNEAVNGILQSVDMRLLWALREPAKATDAHKDDRATQRRRKSLMPALKHNTLRSTAKKYLAELFVGEDVLRAGVSSLTESDFVSPFHPFGITSVLGVLFVWFFWRGRFLLFSLSWFTDFSVFFKMMGCTSRHFQDCHHRHDERSNGVKKNRLQYT